MSYYFYRKTLNKIRSWFIWIYSFCWLFNPSVDCRKKQITLLAMINQMIIFSLGFTINRICAASLIALTRYSHINRSKAKWTTVFIGLGSIPFIVSFIHQKKIRLLIITILSHCRSSQSITLLITLWIHFSERTLNCKNWLIFNWTKSRIVDGSTLINKEWT